MKVGIQGVKGSYHHLVAQNYFESIELVECMTFDELTRSLVNEKCNVAVMAIENSIAGSILPNYALIDENNLFITGECNFNINHNLLSLPNQDINDIKEVHSHPMALLQCSKFFSKHPSIKLIETNDTALFAKLAKGQIKIDPEREAMFYEWAWEYLPNQGYSQYEVSNYARDGHECRHNLNIN